MEVVNLIVERKLRNGQDDRLAACTGCGTELSPDDEHPERQADEIRELRLASIGGLGGLSWRSLHQTEPPDCEHSSCRVLLVIRDELAGSKRRSGIKATLAETLGMTLLQLLAKCMLPDRADDNAFTRSMFYCRGAELYLTTDGALRRDCCIA